MTGAVIRDRRTVIRGHATEPRSTHARPYTALLERLRPIPRGTGPSDRDRLMRASIDVLWNELSPTGVSWIGFYTKPAGREELVLGPCRDKPACSPIGLHGACGRCWRERRPLVVRDVATLGVNYVACDPRDRSEVVVPLLEADGACWGVLDADSHEAGAFDESDARGLTEAMDRLGLTVTPSPAPEPLVL